MVKAVGKCSVVIDQYVALCNYPMDLFMRTEKELKVNA